MRCRSFAGHVGVACLLLGCESEITVERPSVPGQGGGPPAIGTEAPSQAGAGGGGGDAEERELIGPLPDAAQATWQTASETPIFCEGHTATRVDDGSVLIVGLCFIDGELEPRGALVYDIDARTFMPVEMAEPRGFHAALLLEDGRVAIAGDGMHIEYFGLDGSFELGPELLTARFEPAVLRLPSNRIWIIGGYDENGTTLATTEIVDASSGTSMVGPTLATPRVRPAVLRNGPCGAWVIGGTDMGFGATVAATTEAATCPACPFEVGPDLPDGNPPVLAMGDYTSGILVTPTWAAQTTDTTLGAIVEHEGQIQFPTMGMTDTGRYVGVGGDIYALGERFIEISLEEPAKIVATRDTDPYLRPSLTAIGGDSLLVIGGDAAIFTLAASKK